ncbi:MAG: DUF2237 domain-containing protein [Betaproteobacteria bacterium]|jgi:uncharacterized protein (DUF2237 family)|nr:DUF2237 domain-containing protein [Betaproteobacteria bacterium]MCC7216490.1 DUF2237 domain-containing protein [Burkholderiales bacterium]
MAVSRDNALNVLGGPLAPCGTVPRTGFYRNGCCDTGHDDVGMHTVCAVMTDAFLAFSRRAGNDLSTPRPDLGFPGLAAGDRWCLCVGRWREAFAAGVAPPVVLAATHEEALAVVPLEDLERHALA